jgi:hypothetical protein
VTTSHHQPVQDLAAWLLASTYRAFHCDGCHQPIVVTRTDWLHPVYIWAHTPRDGIPLVAHCPYRRYTSGITQHSTPVTSH